MKPTNQSSRQPARKDHPRATAEDLPTSSLELPTEDQLRTVVIRSGARSGLVFRKQVADVPGAVVPGDIVKVVHVSGDPIGFGMVNPRAELVVRMLTRGEERPGADWWQQQFEQAVALRRDLLRLDEQTDAYRVIHAEGDGLSGLVADRLGDVLSVEAYSAGVVRRGAAIAERLAPLVGASHWMVRGAPKIEQHERVACPTLTSDGCPAFTEIREFGTRFRIRFEEGHKTGFFCDQRENRRRLAGWCAGKRVLDLCAYTGGFAVQAKRLGPAAEVTAVELDERPAALAQENAHLNQLRINVVQADAFAYARDMIRLGRRYDVVVLDPPKFITSRAEYEEGKRKHYDLNRLAMLLVEKGGLLVTCCCAGLLAGDEFTDLVLAAARHTSSVHDPSINGRRVQIIDQTGAAPDHPIADFCPETEYLKALWLRVL